MEDLGLTASDVARVDFRVPKDASLLETGGMRIAADAFADQQEQAWLERLEQAYEEDRALFENSPSFDDTVRLAAELTGSPMAAVSLLDEKAQWFKAQVGIPVPGSRRESAFCRFTVEQDEVFTVSNAATDVRFAQNPFVAGDLHVRAYAGAPLIMPDGECVGTLCVLDSEPRSFGDREQQVLALLARQVVSQLLLEQLIHNQARDIANLQVARAEMRHMAMHDELTGLLNRRGVLHALRLMTSGHPSTRAAMIQGVSVLFIDLDGFKAVNDTWGHEVGDRVLVEVAERVKSVASIGQVVARLGGDEFIMLTLGADEAGLTAQAKRVLHAVEQPMVIDGESLVIEASIGLSSSPDATNVAALIDRADRAMYLSKEAGGSGVSFWSADGDQPAAVAEDVLHKRIANKFVRSCLEGDRIRVQFQPMFDLEAGVLVRREALLRWEGPAPDDLDVAGFIEAAESTGLIRPIGSQMLFESCRAAAAWQRDEPGVGVAVNVSARQVTAELAQVVSKALEQSNLSPHLLTLELTESSVLDQTDETHDALEAVHDLGVRLALDDFGTGYASMSMLCALPLDEVKIDREFCVNFDGDFDSATAKVVRATVDLGHALGLLVVAEGIETQAMLDKLADLGCDVGQGYLLGRPAFIDLA